MRKLLYTVITLIAVITFSCDNTAPSFDEALPDYRTLTTTVTPEASGTIEPEGGEYIEGAGIEIQAVPEDGYVFDRWEEDLSGSTNPDSLFFIGDKSVTAVFVPSDYPLTVTIVGSGTVSEEVVDRSEKHIVLEKPLKPSENELKSDQNTERVLRDNKLDRKFTEGSFNPESIPQNIESETVQNSQVVTTTVRLTAEPEEGWYFDRWEGDLTRTENPTEIVIDHEEKKNITAVFEEEIQEYTLNVETQGNGSVDADPDMNSYTEGEEVTLTATPNSEWEFIEWQGDLSGSSNPETIIMDADKSILARFELRDAPTMSITSQPSESTAGSPVSPAPQVVLTDDQGNPMNNIEITASLSENEFTSGSTLTKTTSSDGAVEFDDLIIEISGTDYTLTFDAEASSVSDVIITSNPFDVIPAPADPASSTAVVPDGFSGNPTTITITLEDEFGNLVSGASDQLTVNVSGANTESAGISESEDPGEYTATYTPTVAGTDNIEIEVDGTPIAGSPFSSEVTTSDVNSSNSSVTANPTTLQVGGNSEVSVEVRDNSNNPITDLGSGDFNISVSGNGSANTISETTTDGTYSFDVTNTTAEEVSVTVIVTGVTLEEAQITFTAADPNDMQITTEPDESVAGQPISGSPAVQITDIFGNPVSLVSVTVSEQGGESFSSSSTTSIDTNSDGFAVFDDISIEAVGTYNLVFSSTGLTSRTSNAFTVEAAQADPGSTTATVPEGTAGEETTITIDVSDEFGNPISGAANQLTVNVSGANSESPAVSESGNPGEYTASYTPTSSGTDNVEIELDGFPISGSPFSSEVSASEVSSSNSSVTASPTSLQVGSNSEVTVELKDGNNNPITGLNSGDFNISVSGDGSANTISETATAGTYSFDVTNTTAEDVTVTVTATGVLLNDVLITYIAADPNDMQISTEPGESVAGQLIAGPPIVQITDTFGNPVSSVNVTVSEQGEEPFSSSSTLSADTNNDGFAVFDNIAIETAGTYNLEFSSAGLPNQISSAFTVEAAPSDPGSTTATVPDGTAGEETTITIDVFDEFGNPVSGTANQIIVTVNGANSESPAVSESVNPGEYTASYTPTTSGTDNIEIELDGSPISGSPFSSEVSPGIAVSYEINAIASPQTAGVPFSITLTAVDANDNTATGYNGTANLSTTAGDVTPVTASFTNGTATLDVEVTETGINQTITATDSEDTGITQISNLFDVEPGEVSPNLSEVSTTSPHTADGTDASTVTIVLRDTEGNAIGGLLDTDFTIEVGTNASAETVNESVTDGTYTVEVTNNTPETVTVEVTANGVLLDENPTILFEI